MRTFALKTSRWKSIPRGICPQNGKQCFSQAWIENGYEIMHLPLDKKYIVFRQTEKKPVSLDIPDVFLNTRIPVEALHELKGYFEYIIDKYGLRAHFIGQRLLGLRISETEKLRQFLN